ncbi:hypothetical protein [Aliikangiella coralliicola]|uniref:Uncharacterized protein n=1 Tax=Aliikangiella coralliicola TaxID=2592383 RepID=A0A545UFP6_9GAMM|nr:hypothetical protein [Aliikangiella coralliicola]TQV88296.1 hypothetical protein FLL46_07140 [Aliikangiella coralliicola]
MKSDLDSQTYDRWLIDSCIYQDNTLAIELVGGILSKEKEDIDLGEGNIIKGVYRVEPKGPRYRVYFDDVVFIQVFDECANKGQDDEFRDEGVIGQYKSSSLLSYIKSETLIMDITPGELLHFEVRTGEDWFHVVTREEPSITKTVT